MRLRLVLAPLAVAASLALPSPPASAAACASPPPTEPATGAVALPGQQETEVRWTRVTRTLRYGATATLEGQVVDAEGALPDAKVELFARPAGASTWTQIASTTSDPETGVFAFGCLSPRHNTDYRASYAGDLLHSASEATRRVGVSRQVPDDMRPVGPGRLVYSGAVAPRFRGQVVLQYRSDRGGWSRVAVTRADRRSTWRFVLRDARRGSYRAVVPSDARFVTSPSDHVWRITRS